MGKASEPYARRCSECRAGHKRPDGNRVTRSRLYKQKIKEDRPRGPMIHPPEGGKPYEDMTGLLFGKWRVVQLAGRGDNRHRRWLCRCDCGVERLIAGNDLRSHASGGCQRCKSLRQRKVAKRRVWQRILIGAKRRCLEVGVDFKTVFRLLKEQKYRCALTGLSLVLAVGVTAFMRGQTTASLDRIDSSKGYVEGNIWWVHKDVNRMKNDFSIDHFLELCRLVARRNKK